MKPIGQEVKKKKGGQKGIAEKKDAIPCYCREFDIQYMIKLRQKNMRSKKLILWFAYSYSSHVIALENIIQPSKMKAENNMSSEEQGNGQQYTEHKLVVDQLSDPFRRHSWANISLLSWAEKHIRAGHVLLLQEK